MCLQLPAYNSFNLKSSCTWQVVVDICIYQGSLCQISIIICFCNWLFTPYFQQASTVSIMKSLYHRMVLNNLNAIILWSLPSRAWRWDDKVRQEHHWQCPQVIRMLLNRPSLRQTGLNLHLINTNSIRADNWYLTYYSSLLKFALLFNGDYLRKLIKFFFNKVKKSFNYLEHTMTFNPLIPRFRRVWRGRCQESQLAAEATGLRPSALRTVRYL